MRQGRRAFTLVAGLAPLWASASLRAAPPAGISDTLGVAARDLFPHDTVPDTRYLGIAQAFVDAGPALAEGLAALLGGGYTQRPAPERASVLRQHEYNPGFQSFRLHTLMQLYADLSVTREFGYEGPSLARGGYVNRGFNDLDWLPSPDDGQH